MRRALRHLVDNLGSMLLALLLAFAIWIAATLEVDPFETQVTSNVPITLLNQPPDTIIMEPIAEQASIEVRAPKSVLEALQVSHFEASMDLENVELGAVVEVPVQVRSEIEAVRIQAVDPVQQPVYLEMMRSATIPVTLLVEGEAAIGYTAGSARVTPTEVEVHGAEPFLNRVVSMTGSVDIEGVNETVVEQVLVTPRDETDQLVAGVQWAPDRVEAQVPVRRRLGFKPDVEVIPDLQVSPAPGYRLGSVQVEPSVVTLKGPPSVLDQMPGFIRTSPLSVTEATQNLVEHTPLTVPASVVVVGSNYVTVTVEVLPIESSRTMTGVVELVGIPTDWTSTAFPDVVDVLLEGPDTLVSELQPEDIQILVNLYDYPLGIHRIEPEVLAPEGVVVVNVIPETIEVEIERIPEPSLPTNSLPYIVEPPP